MGVEIVKAAMVYGRNLSGNGYKVLMTMSMTALDKGKDGKRPNLYWAGWDVLAVAMGYPEGQAYDRNTAAHKAVKRALRELRDASHITPLIDAGRGNRQSYLLHPGGLGKGDQIDPATTGQIDPAKGDKSVPDSRTKMTRPRKETGVEQDLKQDSTTPVPARVQTAREDEKPQGWMRGHKLTGHRFDPAEDGTCYVCSLREDNRKAHPVSLVRGA